MVRRIDGPLGEVAEATKRQIDFGHDEAWVLEIARSEVKAAMDSRAFNAVIDLAQS